MDFYQRPSLSAPKLALITNALARWLPADNGTAAGDSSLSSESRPSSEPSSAAAHFHGWGEAEWEAALWVVYWQNSLPWLAQRLRETGHLIPERPWQELLAIEADSRERTRRMLESGVELVKALADGGIKAVLLKGAVMAANYYPDPLLRPLADLDLLIRPQDRNASVEVVRHLGYRFYSRSAEDVVFLRGERKRNIWAADNVQPVELHHRLTEEYAGVGYPLAEEMWRHSRPQRFWQDQEALIPAHQALLHHICAHATSDWLVQRGRLMHVDDIRKVTVHMEAADWSAFQTAVAPQNARFVYPALAFASKYYQIAVPGMVLSHLRNHCTPDLLAWIDGTELADNSESNPTVRSGIGFDMARRLSRSRLEIARFWLRSLLPRRWNLYKRYPRLISTPLWPLAYLLINLDRAWHILRKRFS
jgi:hypothetical protein